MSTPITPTDRTAVRRLPKRGSYDRGVLHAILDEGLVCHVGFAVDGQPYVIPTTYGRVGDRLYLHLFAWPFRHVHLSGLAGRVGYAQLLHDASEVRTSAVDPEQVADTITMSGLPAGTLTIELPIQRPDVEVPVVELFLVPGS